jgi:hypothetical protein
MSWMMNSIVHNPSEEVGSLAGPQSVGETSGLGPIHGSCRVYSKSFIPLWTLWWCPSSNPLRNPILVRDLQLLLSES